MTKIDIKMNPMPKRPFRRLLYRNDGAAFIEFAIVLPIVLLLMMGIVEYSLIMFGNAVLEGALFNAARTGGTNYTGICPGATAKAASQQAYITCLLDSRTSPLLASGNLQLTATDYSSGYGTLTGITFKACNNIVGDPNNCANSQNFGASGDIVLYTVQYPWHIVTPFLQSMLGDGSGNVILQSSALVKNEPF